MPGVHDQETTLRGYAERGFFLRRERQRTLVAVPLTTKPPACARGQCLPEPCLLPHGASSHPVDARSRRAAERVRRRGRARRGGRTTSAPRRREAGGCAESGLWGDVYPWEGATQKHGDFHRRFRRDRGRGAVQSGGGDLLW